MAARVSEVRLAGLALMGMAVLWGSTFFVIKDTLDRIPAADLLGVRFTIATLVLLVVVPKALRMSKRTLAQGVVLGVLFGAAQLTQTVGLGLTAASISGFLTGLYVVFTPLLESTVFRRRISRSVWVAVVLATLGMAFLTVAPGALSGRFGLGEALTVLCALLYAAHIVAAGRFATPDNAMSLTLMQTIVMTLMCLVFALPGGIVLPAGLNDWLVVGYLAIICGSLTLFLQIWAQARIEPTRASVIMCTEPVWAAVFAVLLGGELLRFNTVVGGAIMMAGIYLAIIAPTRRPVTDEGQRVVDSTSPSASPA